MNDILSRAILLARSKVGVHDVHVSTRVEKLARSLSYVWHVGTRLKLVKISLITVEPTNAYVIRGKN